MKTIETRFFEYAQEALAISEYEDSVFFRHFDLFSSIATESFYVINVITNRFCYVSPNDLFLCGHSVEEALQLGNDFYKKIVYPDDLLLWEKMRKAVLRYLKDSNDNWDKVDYFCCTFRLQRKYSSLHPRPLSQMVYHRMKPIWKNDELYYLICSVRSSATQKAGNLCKYYKDGLTYEEYNSTTQRWKRKTIEPLTERERAILMLAQQGKRSKEIANNLYKGHNTIRNQITQLFSKLNVHSMQEAVDFAGNQIYPKREIELQPVEMHYKRSQVLLNEDKLLRIQQHLDDGKSNRQAAKLEGIAESTIRYWIGKGKLVVPSKNQLFVT